MPKTKSGLTIDTEYMINGKGAKLFGVYNPDQEIAGFFFGRKKGTMLLDAYEDDPAGFMALLRTFCGRDDAEKTIEYAGDIYGLFRDGSIKIRRAHEGNLYWDDKIGRKGKVLTAETFDNPESLNVPTQAAPRSSATVDALAAMQAKLDAQAAQNAKLQAMMMQVLQAQSK